MNKLNKILEVIKKYKVHCICGILIILSIISIIIQKIDKESEFKINGVEVGSKNGKIAVYLSGEVKTPGVYYVEPDVRLDKLLDMAGGVTDKADIDKLNLAQKLSDADKIVVWAKSENVDKETGENKSEESDVDNTEVESKSNDCIDINIANKEGLMSLPGIGESTAEKIITYRKDNTFEKIEDIKNVSGIGDAKFNAIKNNICVD